MHSSFLKILSSALTGTIPNPTLVNTQEQAHIFELAELHKVLPLVYDRMHHSGFDLSQSTQIHKRVRLLVSQQALHTLAFAQIYSTLLQQGISPVVVKGIICRDLYPNPDLRISSDEDLLVSPEEYPLCCKLLTDMGFHPAHEKSPEHYQHSFINDDGVYLEIHTSLFDTNDPFFNTWNNVFDGNSDRPAKVSIQNQDFLTLEPTMHLLYLILHALKHFVHSGVGIRQVCDIVLFANKYSKEVAWQIFADKCKELGATQFAMGIFAIGKNHLNLCCEVSDTLSRYASFPKSEYSLLQDILSAGIYGSATLSRKHSSSITFSYAKNKNKGLLKRIFPSAKSLSNRYSYAQKRPLLLPVAWAHRLLHYRKEVKTTDNNSPIEAVRIGKQRLKLLNEYGLIKKRQF